MKKVFRILAVMFATAFISGYAFAQEAEVPKFLDGTVRVTAEEVINLVDKYDNLVIIDARKKSDVAKGYIEGAISLPNTETNAASLAKVIPSKSTPILIYCNGIRCHRSVDSAGVAVASGYTHVYWFRGGIQEWEAKGLPVVHPK